MTLFRRILVPHDFSDHATRALVLAADLAAAHRGRLTVLHVVVPVIPMTGFPPDGALWIPDVDMEKEARRHLERIVERALRGRKGVKAKPVVTVGNPSQSIIDAARGHDSIVMTTAGRSGLAHLVIGSVAERVVRHATVPVLTLRPKDRARRRGRRR